MLKLCAATGDHVLVQRLESAAQYNGKVAKVLRFDVEKGTSMMRRAARHTAAPSIYTTCFPVLLLLIELHAMSTQWQGAMSYGFARNLLMGPRASS